MRITCPNCGGPHPKWECKKPLKATTAQASSVARPRPGDRRVKSSTQKSADEGVSQKPETVPTVPQAGSLGTQPVNSSASSPSGKASGFGPDTVGSNPAEATKRRGRPPSDNPKSPRAAYMRELMRKRRAAQKEAKP